jgi:hypothetical protein
MILKIVGLGLVALGAMAQTWTGSGSTGADGAFVLTATDSRIANGVFVFDPVRDNLDKNGTNIYNFTQITIPENVTVQVRANKLRQPGPMVWLSSGAVLIGGYIDVSGNNGHDATVSLSVRAPSQPGPGGFPGGAGAKPGDVPERGFGPGGGVAPAGTGSSGCPAGFATAYLPGSAAYFGAAARCAGGGVSYGNGNLQPFIGGSGGSGGYPNTAANQTGPGGGAGGGALRIASDVSITISRQALGCCSASAGIYANGGNPGAVTSGGGANSSTSQITGGAGSGGSIHLQAPVVTIGRDANDFVQANGGYYTFNSYQPSYYEYGSAGRVRIDTNSLQVNGVITPTPVIGPLVNVPLPTNQPTVSVVSIGGVNVPVQPTGAYTVPDISINNMGNIPVVISTTNIPNTTLNLYITTEPGTTDFVTPVTLTNGQGSANITLPQGVSRFVVRAAW